MDRRSPRATPSFCDLYSSRIRRLSYISLQPDVDIPLSWPGVRDGVVEHGLASYLRRNRRRTSKRAAIDGLYDTVDLEACADGYRTDIGRSVDSSVRNNYRCQNGPDSDAGIGGHLRTYSS